MTDSDLSGRQPWDQLTDNEGPLGPEDDEWYARFLSYLNLPHPRSYRKAYEAYGLGKDADPYNISSVWRARIQEYRWAERVAAWDKAQQLARRGQHKTTADDVWDTLYAGANRAARVLVGYATDRKHLGKNPQQDRIRVQAAAEVLDRLGFSKRAARPIYSEAAEDADKPLLIELVNTSKEQLNAIAGWDNDDDDD
jgi:hypothetical protein